MQSRNNRRCFSAFLLLSCLVLPSAAFVAPGPRQNAVLSLLLPTHTTSSTTTTRETCQLWLAKRRGKLGSLVETGEIAKPTRTVPKKRSKRAPKKKSAGSSSSSAAIGSKNNNDASAISPLLQQWASGQQQQQQGDNDYDEEDNDGDTSLVVDDDATSSATSYTSFVKETTQEEASSKKSGKKSSKQSQDTDRKAVVQGLVKQLQTVLDERTENNKKTSDISDILQPIRQLLDLPNGNTNLRQLIAGSNRQDYRLTWVGSDNAVCHMGTGLHNVPLARLQEVFLSLVGTSRMEILEVIRIIGPFPNVRNTLEGACKIGKRGLVYGDDNDNTNNDGNSGFERSISELGITYDSMIDGTGKQITAGMEGSVRKLNVHIAFCDENAIVAIVPPEDGGVLQDPFENNGASILFFAKEDDLEEKLDALRVSSPSTKGKSTSIATTTTSTTSNKNKKKPPTTKAKGTKMVEGTKRRKRKQRRLTFSVMFERLTCFQQQHGHCLVAVDDPDQELFKWTRSIRKNYKHQFTQQVRAKKPKQQRPDSKSKNKEQALSNSAALRATSSGGHKTRRPMLSDSKVKLLQSVSFCWDVQGALWEQRYQQLAEFYEMYQQNDTLNENNNNNIEASNSAAAQPSLSSVHAEDPGLAIWLQNQRRDYRLWQQDLPSPLMPERLEALEELGVVDDYQTQQEAWAQHYQYLVEYDQKRGHVNVPQNFLHPVEINVIDADGQVRQRKTTFALGQWCMNQRTARRKWDALQQEQRQHQADATATATSKKQQKPKTKTKKASGSAGSNSGDVKTIISVFRIRLLDALDFSWNALATKWQNMLGRLQEYYRRHGHLKIATDDTANQDLRNWLIAQRHYYQRQRQPHQSSPMTESRIETMEGAIPDFSWKAYANPGGPSSEDWSNLFTAMRDKGISPGVRPKQHWFEGQNPFSAEVKSDWTEQELVDLWHQEGGDDEEDDDHSGDELKNNGFYVNWEDGATEAKEKASSWEIGADGLSSFSNKPVGNLCVC